MGIINKALKFPPILFTVVIVISFLAVQAYSQNLDEEPAFEIQHLTPTISTDDCRYDSGSWVNIMVMVGMDAHGGDEHAHGEEEDAMDDMAAEGDAGHDDEGAEAGHAHEEEDAMDMEGMDMTTAECAPDHDDEGAEAGHAHEEEGAMDDMAAEGDAGHDDEGADHDDEGADAGDHEEEDGGMVMEYEGAKVKITIYSPDGTIFIEREGTVDSQNMANFKVKIDEDSPSGFYSIIGEVTLEGQPSILGQSLSIEIE